MRRAPRRRRAAAAVIIVTAAVLFGRAVLRRAYAHGDLINDALDEHQ